MSRLIAADYTNLFDQEVAITKDAAHCWIVDLSRVVASSDSLLLKAAAIGAELSSRRHQRPSGVALRLFPFSASKARDEQVPSAFVSHQTCTGHGADIVYSSIIQGIVLRPSALGLRLDQA